MMFSYKVLKVQNISFLWLVPNFVLHVIKYFKEHVYIQNSGPPAYIEFFLSKVSLSQSKNSADDELTVISSCEVTLIQSSNHSALCECGSHADTHLLEFLHHLLDVQVGVVRHLVLHLCEPLAQLLVLLVEDDPGVQTIRDLLLAQRHLKRRGSELNDFYYFRSLSVSYFCSCMCIQILIHVNKKIKVKLNHIT